jgi:hypothetical protein
VRARYERDEVEAILDDGFLCHVTCAVDGQPCVIPMIYVRLGSELVVHGSSGNRALRALDSGAEAAISVMHCDGLIAARSAFHHSVNYRSVVIYGQARELVGPEKDKALSAFLHVIAPGRETDCRPPNDEELRRTMVLAIPLDEASAKVRGGGPAEEEGDWDLPYWAGVIPLTTTRGTPIACERLAHGIELPEYLDRPRAPART